MTKKMTRTEEHDYYADPENQTPQGPARTPRFEAHRARAGSLPPETLDRIRNAAGADDRSITSWIRPSRRT